MTRNEAKNIIIRNNADWVWHETIDKIFDEFGEKLQDKDDEIELLKCRIEEAMKPKTCEGCKSLYINQYDEWSNYCKELNIEISNSTTSTFYCNRYEPKEQ